MKVFNMNSVLGCTPDYARDFKETQQGHLHVPTTLSELAARIQNQD